jgi:mono/diheme cytochrome c family protein
VTTENELTEGVEKAEEPKSFFARGALLGLVGGAVVALMLISVAGSVVSLFDNVFGSSTSAAAEVAVEVDPVVAVGEGLATSNGCIACHSTDGVDGAGPSWKGLAQSVDADYIRTSILDPNAVIAEGFIADVMPSTYADTLSAEDVDALVAYISSL